MFNIPCTPFSCEFKLSTMNVQWRLWMATQCPWLKISTRRSPKLTDPSESPGNVLVEHHVIVGSSSGSSLWDSLWACNRSDSLRRKRDSGCSKPGLSDMAPSQNHKTGQKLQETNLAKMAAHDIWLDSDICLAGQALNLILKFDTGLESGVCRQP